jgi:hypothetical protein
MTDLQKKALILRARLGASSTVFEEKEVTFDLMVEMLLQQEKTNILLDEIAEQFRPTHEIVKSESGLSLKPIEKPKTDHDDGL